MDYKQMAHMAKAMEGNATRVAKAADTVNWATFESSETNVYCAC